MAMMASQNVPDQVIRQMLVSAVQIVIHCTRLSDGTRKLTAITEVCGVEDEHVEMREIFRLERSGVSQDGQVLGTFRATGVEPRCLDRLRAYGVRLPASIFTEQHELKHW